MKATFKKGLLYQLPTTGFLLIESDVVEKINGFRQLGKQGESGGFLIGYNRPPHLHITDITTPFNADISTRYRFVRQDPLHIKKMRALHLKTYGHLNLIGEWHTHPQEPPHPSSIDRLTWSEITVKRKKQPTIFIIAGTSSFWVSHATGVAFKHQIC